MRERTEQRIAILQADWPVHSQTTNLAVMFAEAGYAVEVFFYNTLNDWSYSKFERDRLSQLTGIEIHDIDLSSSSHSVAEGRNGDISLGHRLKTFIEAKIPGAARVHNYVRRAVRKTHETYRFIRSSSEEDVLPGVIVSKALELMTGRAYQCLIGIEKHGMIWAGRVAKTLKVPFVYYNLELYTWDYWRLRMGKSPEFRKLRLAECRHHRKAAATIIQDPERAGVLCRENGLAMSKSRMFYLPVSSLGDPRRERSRRLHKSLGLPKESKIILYFGQIWEKRYVLELAQAAQTFPEDWVLVMHGWGEPSSIENVKRVDRRQRVAFSLDLVSSEELREVMCSADIGLAFYTDEIENERLTAFASEKMALYMQCGVPFIAFDYPGYRRLADEDRCGAVIREMQELPGAINRILLAQEEYRARAFQAFERHFDFARNFTNVLEGIQRL